MARPFWLWGLVFLAWGGAAAAGLKLPAPEPPAEMLMMAPGPAISAGERAPYLAKAAAVLARREKEDAVKAAAYMEASRYFESAGEYEKAAAWAGKAAGKIRNGAEAGAAVLRAGQMWERAAKYKEAAKTFEKLYKTAAYKGQPFVYGGETLTFGEAGALQAGVCRELIGDYKGAARHYGDYIGAYSARPAPLIWAYYRRGRALATLGKDAEARVSFQKALDVVRSYAGNEAYDLTPALGAAAGAEFFGAEYDYRAFAVYRLKLPQARMESDLREMLALSRKLVSSYNDIAGAGVPEWEVAALCRLGDTYGAFGAALAAAELPKDINPKNWRRKKAGDPARATAEDGYNAYMKALDGQLRPLRRNAFDNYVKTLKAATAAGVDDDWSRRARVERDKLAKEYGFSEAPPIEGESLGIETDNHEPN